MELQERSPRVPKAPIFEESIMDEDPMNYRPQFDKYRDVGEKKPQQSSANPPWWAWVLLAIVAGLAMHHFWMFNIQG